MDENTGDTNTRTHSDGDIRIEYHPSSGREPEMFTPGKFTGTEFKHTPPEDPEPWAPFRTRADFEFAAIVQDTRMSKAKAKALIRLFRKCVESGADSFTLSSYAEMQKTLKTASERLPKVCSCACLYISYSLIFYGPSLRRNLFLKPTKEKNRISMSGCVRYGHGLKICCKTQILSITLCGMPAICQGLMENQALGFGCMMNHGQQTDSGRLKYVVLLRITLHVVNTHMKSQTSHLGQSLWYSVCMQTRQNCPHLAPRRAIL